MSEKIIHRNLKYQFSREELEEIAEAMAQAAGERDEAESRKKSAMAQLKAEIEEATATHQKYSRKYRDKFEYRGIDCEKVLDHVKGTVTVTRLDTGEIIEEREMTVEERQRELKLYPPETEIDRDPEVTETMEPLPEGDQEVVDACKALADDYLNEVSEQELTPEEIERGVAEHGEKLEQS